ncbi:MAG: hypothetical protein WCS30_00180 [Selenomonadaceae bacterium]
MNGVIRVFPQRTSFTPSDPYAFVGLPPHEMFIPEHDEVHVCGVFSWDKKYCEDLAYQWEGKTKKQVKLGGPAFGSEVNEFKQGMYIKPNIIFTSRGCNNNCPWCIVPKLEGRLRELPICSGNIIQDNNFLQANKTHKDKVFEMLKSQKHVVFKGGLETDLIDDRFINGCTSLKYLPELWIACDTDGAIQRLKKATEKLKKAGFDRNKIYCYALIGDDMDKNEARLQEIYHAGAMPFAQLYQPIGADIKQDYSDDWKKFHRMWSRPAATVTHCEKGTSFKNFNT